MKEIGNIFDRYDLFGVEIPKFHIEGNKKIGTGIGFVLSVLFTTLVIGYSGVRIRYLFLADRPSISAFTGNNERDGLEAIDLKDFHFKVAFTVESIKEQGVHESANDPDFVEWAAFIYDSQNERKYTMFQVHKCHHHDYEEFHDFVESQKVEIEAIKQRTGFYCLDDYDQFGNPVNLTLFGNYYSGVYSDLQIIYKPCMPKQRNEYNKNDEKCLIDDINNQTQLDAMLERSKAYLGNTAQLKILLNFDQFMPDQYGEASIQKRAKLTSRQFGSEHPTFAFVRTNIDSIEDETSFVNLGQYQEKEYIQFRIEPNEISAQTNYPFQYKFMSIDFDLNMDIMHIDRTTYDLLEMMGDVGGVIGILQIVFGVIASPFAELRIQAIVTNRLFHLSAQNRQELFGDANLTDQQLKDYNLHKNAKGQILLNLPRFLIYDYIVNFCCTCNSSKSDFGKYREITDLGMFNFEQDLDLVNLIKRLRMYGLTFFQQLSKKDRDLSAHIALFRPLKAQDEFIPNKDAESWDKLEGITFMDRLQVAMQIRF